MRVPPAIAWCAVAASASSTACSPRSSSIGTTRVAGDDEPGGGAAEQAAHLAEAAGAGHEHALADAAARSAAPACDDAADRLVAGHQRVAHAGEGRHPAGPEQPLGAGADAAPLDVDDDVARRRAASARAGCSAKLFGRLEHHGQRVHCRHSLPDACRPMPASCYVSGYIDCL